MRRKIVAGNWKMNLLPDEANTLYDQLNNASYSDQAEVIVFPPMLYVQGLHRQHGKVPVGVQNFHPSSQGAFTGEVSVEQIAAEGISYALVGHSERRSLFGEDHDFLKQKVDAAIRHGISPVFCCGEPLEIREKGEELNFVKVQLEESLFHLNEEEIVRCVIAYEPVWAIGTGKTATTQQAEDMHREIRSWVAERYNDAIAGSISILYGGSCNASNAPELFTCPNVDGGLIGGASLKSDSFLQIVASF